jgi:hypothetical protein
MSAPLNLFASCPQCHRCSSLNENHLRYSTGDLPSFGDIVSFQEKEWILTHFLMGYVQILGLRHPGKDVVEITEVTPIHLRLKELLSPADYERFKTNNSAPNELPSTPIFSRFKRQKVATQLVEME